QLHYGPPLILLEVVIGAARCTVSIGLRQEQFDPEDRNLVRRAEFNDSQNFREGECWFVAHFADDGGSDTRYLFEILSHYVYSNVALVRKHYANSRRALLRSLFNAH